ncbi:P-loop containing nucleoside triphosphate hydrolase protein [Aspergillus venezuelensis]
MAYQVFWLILPRGVPREPHQWLTTPAAHGGRVIIYANIKSQVEAISQELGCEPYHSKVVNQAGVMQWFQDGQTQVIAATSALGMGINIPNIQCVIHISWPRMLLDYGQESGQARQDRLASEAVYLDGIVNGYTWQQCQDINPGKLPCDACDPDWEA